jgi:hypothetical protein
MGRIRHGPLWAQVAALLDCIQELLGSILGRGTEYLQSEVLRGFSQYHHRDETLKLDHYSSLPHYFQFIIHCHRIIRRYMIYNMNVSLR